MVKGLEESSGEGAVLDAFTSFGQVKEIRLVRDRVNRVSRGFAFVEFHSLASAKAVVDSTQPILVDGVAVRASFARDVRGGSSHESADGSSAGFEQTQQQGLAHQGPKRAGFGIPNGFLPDQATGYYFSAETGYYYDADTKLYFYPATSLWYEADPVTGHLREHVTAEQRAATEAAAHEAAVAEAEKQRAARIAAKNGGSAAGTSSEAAAAPVALVENHSKVVLGLGKGKKGAAKVSQPVGIFKQAVKEADDEIAEEEKALVDWKGLICNLCKRRLKDLATLTKHVEASELHLTNLSKWRADKGL